MGGGRFIVYDSAANEFVLNEVTVVSRVMYVLQCIVSPVKMLLHATIPSVNTPREDFSHKTEYLGESLESSVVAEHDAPPPVSLQGCYLHLHRLLSRLHPHHDLLLGDPWPALPRLLGGHGSGVCGGRHVLPQPGLLGGGGSHGPRQHGYFQRVRIQHILPALRPGLPLAAVPHGPPRPSLHWLGGQRVDTRHIRATCSQHRVLDSRGAISVCDQVLFGRVVFGIVLSVCLRCHLYWLSDRLVDWFYSKYPSLGLFVSLSLCLFVLLL